MAPRSATSHRFSPSSLRGTGSRSTLRLRELMEQQQRIEIGQRIKGLRDNSPQTNRSIGDYVGVVERSVANWIAGKTGIEYDNAQKVAELFSVDVQWLWSGDKPPTPDVLGVIDGNPDIGGTLEEINARLARIEQALGVPVEEAEARPEDFGAHVHEDVLPKLPKRD